MAFNLKSFQAKLMLKINLSSNGSTSHSPKTNGISKKVVRFSEIMKILSLFCHFFVENTNNNDKLSFKTSIITLELSENNNLFFSQSTV